MSVDYFARMASKSPVRIYPRYSPNYQSYQKKITLERVDDDGGDATDGYVGYNRRTNDYVSYHPYFFRDSTSDVSYPPFGYVNSFKAPVRTAQPQILPLKVTEDNMQETRITTTEAVKSFRSRTYRVIGYLVSILAILTFAIEIADVIVATMADVGYCRTSSGFLTIPWFFAWVVPGIWASIPIFITGILAIYVTDNYGRVFKALAIICSVSAFFFAPAIVAVSVAEEATFVQYCPNVLGNVSTMGLMIPDPIKAKLVLPIVITILGILEMLLLLYLTIVLCQAYEVLTSEVILTEGKDSPSSGTAFVPSSIPALMPIPVAIPSPPQPASSEVISILVPRPAETMQPARVPGAGDSAGRVVYMEAHNHGYAYANVPGYFTTLPPSASTAAAPAPTSAGYRWF